MPFATTGRISHDPIEGSVEISDALYRELLDAMLAGKQVVVVDGVASAIVQPAENEPEAEPPVLVNEAAKAMVVARIDQATAGIVYAYPTAERLGWDAKAAEAAAVLAAGAGATLAMAPLLTAECVAEYGAADDATRLAQIAAKAQTVLDKAAAWGQLMATLSGLRGKAFAAIDAAGNDAETLQTAVDAAFGEINAAAEEE